MTHASPFSSSDKGILHKSVLFEGEVHIVEEVQLLKNSESIKNLLLSSEVSGCTKRTQVVSKCSFFTCLLFMCSLGGEKLAKGSLLKDGMGSSCSVVVVVWLQLVDRSDDC